MGTYYEKRYCNECLCIHWVEVTPRDKEICHGTDFSPFIESATHYHRRSTRGIEVIEKIAYRRPIDKGFQMLIDEHNKIS